MRSNSSHVHYSSSAVLWVTASAYTRMSDLEYKQSLASQSQLLRRRHKPMRTRCCTASANFSNHKRLTAAKLGTTRDQLCASLFDGHHPVGAFSKRLGMAYRTRWCNSLGIPRPRALCERVTSRLLWLSEREHPRVHTANIRLHLKGWHSARRYQSMSRCAFCRALGPPKRP